MIPQKYLWIKRLVALRDEIRTISPDAAVIVQRMITDTMPSLHYNVFMFIADCNHALTSRDVTSIFLLNINHANSILNELWQFGLLEREERKNRTGKYFEYRVKGS